MAGTIETTIGALVEAEPALARLASVKLDAKTRYHIVKLAKLVTAETRAHFYEPRQALFCELGVERPPTGAERAKNGPDPVLEISPLNVPEFKARLADLASVPVTLPWGPVTSTMLEPYPEFTGADCLALGPLFELVDEPVTAPT
jgi:hypothetical protein